MFQVASNPIVKDDPEQLILLPPPLSSVGSTGLSHHAWVYTEGDQTQGLVYTRQALYQLDHIASSQN